jgi:hypothetical protein
LGFPSTDFKDEKEEEKSIEDLKKWFIKEY